MDNYRIYSDNIFYDNKNVFDMSLVNRLLYWAHGYLLSNINEHEYQVILSHALNKDILELLNLPNTDYYNIPQLYYNLYSKKISYANFLEFLEKKELPKEDMELIIDDSNMYNIDRNMTQALNKIEIRNEYFKNSIITDENYIGIHLRRGRGVKIDTIVKSKYIDDDTFDKTMDFVCDNVGTDLVYSYISDEKVFEFINCVESTHPDIKFYISTDLPDELTRYFTEYKKDKVITSHNFKKNLKMISRKTGLSYEVIRGYYDLFSLAKCGKVVKTPDSTYSQFASLYKHSEKSNRNYNEDEIDFLIETIFGKRFL